MRILTITGLFPRPNAPTQGVFIRHRVEALRRLGVEARVLVPLPWVPPGPVPAHYRALRETPPETAFDSGLVARYPRYLMVPKIGMRWQAGGYARGIRGFVRDEVARFKPDLIDCHYLYPDACGVARVAGEQGLPYVCTARGSDVKVLGRIAALQPAIRTALAGAGAVVAVSRDLAATMKELGLHAGPIDVIPNGVDRERFRPRARTAARAELGLPPDGRFVLCVGHLVPVHGQALLVRALAEAAAPDDVAIRFVGHGPDREPLEELARSLGVADRVHFQGVVPHAQVPLWLAASNLSAQVSRSAGSPNAVLESMACGIPVLASDIAPMREAIPHADDGLCVPQEPVAVAAGLAELLARPLPDTPLPGPVRGWDEVGAEVLKTLRRVLAG